MGCGWTPAVPVDMNLLEAVEAVNGGSEIPAFSGIPFWEHQLNLGHRLTAIGGSDNHRPMRPLDQAGSIGRPTTVVYATELSTPAILEGIRSGRVFIDLTGSRDRLLEMQARMGSVSATMGGRLDPSSGQTVSLDLHILACAGATVHLPLDGEDSPLLPAQKITAADQKLHFSWQSDGKRHWLLAEVRDGDGRLLLLGNPLYVNWGSEPAAGATASR